MYAYLIIDMAAQFMIQALKLLYSFLRQIFFTSIVHIPLNNIALPPQRAGYPTRSINLCHLDAVILCLKIEKKNVVILYSIV